jgi:hypothetical protein
MLPCWSIFLLCPYFAPLPGLSFGCAPFLPHCLIYPSAVTLFWPFGLSFGCAPIFPPCLVYPSAVPLFCPIIWSILPLCPYFAPLHGLSSGCAPVLPICLVYSPAVPLFYHIVWCILCCAPVLPHCLVYPPAVPQCLVYSPSVPFVLPPLPLSFDCAPLIWIIIYHMCGLESRHLKAIIIIFGS